MAKKKRQRTSKAGSQYERNICHLLSKWWTEGRRDDIFWRTSGSGARATTRRKKKKDTAGSDSDIGIIDDIGKPLIELFAIELKTGYQRQSLFELVDMPKTSALQLWETWHNKVKDSMNYSGAAFWLIIHKRVRREDIVYMPTDAYCTLEEAGAFQKTPRVKVHLKIPLKCKDGERHPVYITAIHLSAFLKLVSRKHIIKCNLLS